MADVTVDAECPACGEEFECVFDPEQEVNDIDCPECFAELMVEAYDPTKNVLVLVEAESDEPTDAVDV